MRKVVVQSYKEEWPTLFEVEKKKLQKIFQTNIVDTHHIGSTSVPLLHAKPIIDIMPVVKDIEQVDLYNEPMLKIGYEALGENGMKGRRFFRKGGELRTHHVHVFQVGDSNVDRHLAFRDYLVTFPKIAKTYGELKSDLANRYPYDIEAYMNGKNDFVQETEKKALEWFKAKREGG